MAIRVTKKKSPAEELLDDLLSEAEAASILGLKPETLRVHRARGVGCSYIKLHKRVLYRRSALATYIARHEVQPALED